MNDTKEHHKMKKGNDKKFQDRVIDSYAGFLTRHPFIIVTIAIVLTIFASYYSGMIKNESMDYSDMLPESYPQIKASNIFSENFGTTESVNIVVEIDPQESGSNEPCDVRDPRVLEYVDRIERYVSSSNQVASTSSAVRILKMMNDGHLPKDINIIKSSMDENGLLRNYISEDGTMTIISISLEYNYDAEELYDDMQEALQAVDAPLGIKTQISGEAIADVIVDKMLSDDMARTSQISMLGIILILVLSFWSFRYGLMPLTTIVIGVIWTMGFIGLVGMGMNTATSGVISMIMGIGIDFGIQVINRFRQEYSALKNIEESMKITLENVIFPMLITTLAAVIGFKAMSMGQLSVLADMGNMMMYGVIFCFLVSITVVPVITIYVERVVQKINRRHKKILGR